MTDEAVIDRVLSGDTGAFAALVDRHKQLAYTLAYRITRSREDAEEIAQDSFLKAYQSLRTFKKEAKFSSWLYRIVYNNAISRMRRKKLPVESLDDNRHEWTEPADATDVLAKVAAGERKRFVGEAMAVLEPDDAAVVTLFYVKDAAVEEISRITGLTAGHVKIKLYRSRKKLFARLQELLQDEMPALSPAS